MCMPFHFANYIVMVLLGSWIFVELHGASSYCIIHTSTKKEFSSFIRPSNTHIVASVRFFGVRPSARLQLSCPLYISLSRWNIVFQTYQMVALRDKVQSSYVGNVRQKLRSHLEGTFRSWLFVTAAYLKNGFRFLHDTLNNCKALSVDVRNKTNKTPVFYMAKLCPLYILYKKNKKKLRIRSIF